MRGTVDRAKLERFLAELGRRARGPGRVYLTGGATALLHGWRTSTVDVDVKLDPEPAGAFEAIAELKEELDLNVELAAPDQFVPPVPGWRERSVFIARHGSVDFFHFDPLSQALAKLAREITVAAKQGGGDPNNCSRIHLPRSTGLVRRGRAVVVRTAPRPSAPAGSNTRCSSPDATKRKSRFLLSLPPFSTSSSSVFSSN